MVIYSNSNGNECIIVLGVCNSLSSVSLQQRFEMVDQCYSLVTTQFYFGKQRIIHPWGVRAGWPKKERPQSILASSFQTFLSAPHWACPMQTGLAKKGACLFHLKFSLQSMDFLLFHFCRLFSLSFSHRQFRLFFPILTTWHSPPLKRWEAQFFGNRVFEVSLATSCWSGIARGIGPPLLASLKPESL